MHSPQPIGAMLLLIVLSWSNYVDAQAAAWPATSYSPYFQSLFAQASAPVAAIPSGPGAQAPSIPVPGPIVPGSPALFGGAPMYSAAPAPGFIGRRRKRQIN